MIWAIIDIGYIDDRGVSGYLKLGGQVIMLRMVDSVDYCHGPLLLDRSVCLPSFAMWPSFGYFSTVT